MQTDTAILLDQAQRMRSDGRGLEDILAFWRGQGCSKIDSIRLVRGLDGRSLAEAKHLVHLSATWADVRAADVAFHDRLADAADAFACREAGR